MTEVFETVRNWPLLWGWSALFGIVMVRAGATYGIGRAVGAGLLKRGEPGEGTRAAIERIHRWGPWAVAASFFTIGIQSVVNFAAGLVRMPLRRYLLGLVPGSAIWATLWFTVGLGALIAFLGGGGVERLVGAIVLVFAFLGIRWWRRGWVQRDRNLEQDVSGDSAKPSDHLS